MTLADDILYINKLGPFFKALACIMVVLSQALPCALAGSGEAPVLSLGYSPEPGVYLAGELTAAQRQQALAAGALLVDLREPDEAGAAAERRQVWRAGGDYLSIPTGSTMLDGAELAFLEEVLSRTTRQPVVLHCSSGNRAGMVYAGVLLRRGLSLDEALRAVAPVATRDGIRDAIRAFARELHRSEPRPQVEPATQ